MHRLPSSFDPYNLNLSRCICSTESVDKILIKCVTYLKGWLKRNVLKTQGENVLASKWESSTVE